MGRERVIALALCAALGGCWVGSSLAYTRGSQALAKGDNPTAIRELEEAVRLDPSLSRNHNDLAVAYMRADRYLDAWPHVRRAVLLDTGSAEARGNFALVYARLIKETDLKVGDSKAEVQTKLGEPDRTWTTNQGDFQAYALIALLFKDDRLVGETQVIPP